MFKNCKKYEIKEYIEITKIKKKNNSVSNEISNSKLDSIKEIDEILYL